MCGLIGRYNCNIQILNQSVANRRPESKLPINNTWS